jgi:hypothetical protein
MPVHEEYKLQNVHGAEQFLYVCHCGRAYRDRGLAERCCSTHICDVCGEELTDLSLGRVRHRACAEELWLAQRANLLAAAEEDPGHTGYIYSDEVSSEYDGYFSSVEDLVDYCYGADIPTPEWAFCCKPRRFTLDAARAIEQAEVNIDLDSVDNYEPTYKGLEEFKEACRVFTEANQHVCTWAEDTKRKVRIPKAEEKPC